MLRQKMHRAIVPAALAGILASTLALSAGPEHPLAHAIEASVPNGKGEYVGAGRRTGRTPKIEAARMALLKHCIAGSDAIAMRAERDSRRDRFAAGPVPTRHAVCYAAIVPGRDEAGTVD